MAWSIVGSPSAVTTGSSPLTTAWGTGANRTSGNLLVSAAMADTFTVGWTATAGWQLALQAAINTNGSGVHGTAAIFYKNATGGDAAPVVTIGTAFARAVNFEFSNGGSGGYLENTASAVNATTSPVVATAAALDPDPLSLVIYVGSADYSASLASGTTAVTLNNGATAHDTNLNSIASSTVYPVFGYGINTSSAAADSASMAFTTTSIIGAGVLLASFTMPPISAYIPHAMPMGV